MTTTTAPSTAAVTPFLTESIRYGSYSSTRVMECDGIPTLSAFLAFFDGSPYRSRMTPVSTLAAAYREIAVHGYAGLGWADYTLTAH